MSIIEMIEQYKREGIATDCVVYANIGNNSDELIVCEPQEADNAGVIVVDIYFIEHNSYMRTAVITAEV